MSGGPGQARSGWEARGGRDVRGWAGAGAGLPVGPPCPAAAQPERLQPASPDGTRSLGWALRACGSCPPGGCGCGGPCAPRGGPGGGWARRADAGGRGRAAAKAVPL